MGCAISHVPVHPFLIMQPHNPRNDFKPGSGDSMRIRELLAHKMPIELQAIQAHVSLLDAARILTANNIGALPVIDDDRAVIGIVSERDLVRAFVEYHDEGLDRPVSDIMITSVVTCCCDDPADDIYETLGARGFRHIPVVEGGKLRAMLSIRDFELAHKRLKSQSLSDDLTGLHNLRHLLTILDGEFNRYRRFRAPLSVAAVKVDQLEEISRSKGPVAGDGLMKKLSKILVEETRAYDSIGRTAEDRFVVVFPNTDPRTAVRACERIMRAVRSGADAAADDTGWSTISIGLAHANFEICEGMRILQWAGELVQAASENGGDCIEVPEPGEAEQAMAVESRPRISTAKMGGYA